MARSVMRRTVSKLLVGAMAVATLGAGQAVLGSGVAYAAPVSETVTTGTVTATKTVDNPDPFPGDTVTTTVVLENSGVDVYLKDFTDLPPAGYVLDVANSTADVHRGGPVAGKRNDPSRFDGNLTQDPVSGAVQMKWTDHGSCAGIACKLVLLDKTAALTFTYKVAANAQPGPRTTGMEFNAYNWSTQRWDTLPQLNLSVQQPITATATTVTVPPMADNGAPVTLSAKVTPSNASGTVQFKDGTTNIGDPVAVVDGFANMSHKFTTDGSHEVSAEFSGTAGFSNSSAAARVVEVSTPEPGAQGSTTVMTAPAAATVGTSVRLTAQVSSTAKLAGTVQFYDDGTPIGPRVAVGDGVVGIDHVFTTAGAHQISASFTGASGVKGSTSTVQTVNVAAAPTPPAAGSLGSIGGLGSLGGGS